MAWPAYSYAWVSFWSILSRDNLVLDWALEVLLPHGDFAYYLFIYGFDFLLNATLILPFAILLRLYLGPSSWASVFIGTLIVFLQSYDNVLFEMRDLSFFLHPGAAIGAFTVLAFFPLAYLLADRLVRSE